MVAFLPAAQAQTWNGAASGTWEDPANWAPASVPDGPTATAIFTATGLAPSGSGISNELTMSGEHTLASLQFLPGTPHVTLFVDNSGGPASLTLGGAGLQNTSSFRQTIWLGDFHDVLNPTPVTLTFTDHATVAGDWQLVAIGTDKTVAFRGHSSAGQAYISAYNLHFYDEATIGSATLDNYFYGSITFHDHSTAGSARLPGATGFITFADSSSAGTATLVRSGPYGPSSGALFRDSSSAGSATLSLTTLTFTGHATAAQASLSNAGWQVYSSHGAYSTQFATLDFLDHATAGSATIGNNSLANLTFADQSTAGNSTISNQGTVIFAGQSSLGSARLIAGSGTYLRNTGYNQPAVPVTIGNVYFQDQATGGNGRIEIASADAIIDFSGLNSGTGTTGRAPLPASPTGPAVVPDDPVVFSLGSLTNTSPGGALYLGGTTLRLGSDNRDMTISARLHDVGGQFGSLAGEPLQGGGLAKVGTGTLTITNPDNDYTGFTGILAGTLNLAGGSITQADLSGTGRLTGTGTVKGSLYNGLPTHLGSSTVVSPGNSIGTITVQGGYFQGADGTLHIEIASATSYDRVVVGGAATLAGTLTLSSLNGYLPVGSTTFNFLTAGSISGQFGTVNTTGSLGAVLSSRLVYAPTGISLQVTQLPFSGFASGSPAASALGAHLDATLSGATGDYRNLIASLNTLPTAANVAAALEALAPDRYSVLAENAFATATARQAALDRRLAAFRTTKPARGFDLFFEAGYRKTAFDTVSSLPAASAKAGSGTVGGAWRNDAFMLGASLTQETGNVDLDVLGSRAELKSLTPTVFFQYAPDRFFLHAAASFSNDDYDLRRRIVYPGVDLTALAAPSGRRTDLAFTVGYAFPHGAWILTPHAGLLTSSWHLDEFAETDAGVAGMLITDTSLRSTRLRAGLDAVYRSTTSSITPRLSVVWLHELKNDRSFQARFGGAGASYTVAGREAEKDLVQVSLSLEKRVGRAASLYASLGGAWGRNSSLTSDLSAGFRWEF